MAVSFSSAAKAEMCRGFPQKKCCAVAQCFGILLFCNSFNSKGIRIITESKEFAQNLPKLFKKAFGISFDLFPEAEVQGKMIFQITDPIKLAVVMGTYGFDVRDTLALHVNLPVVEDDCCKSAFLRGAFLAGGSVTDPEKRYHLELATAHHSVSRELFSILLDLGFSPKETQRAGNLLLYFKQADAIADFFTTIGASTTAGGTWVKVGL